MEITSLGQKLHLSIPTNQEAMIPTLVAPTPQPGHQCWHGFCLCCSDPLKQQLRGLSEDPSCSLPLLLRAPKSQYIVHYIFLNMSALIWEIDRGKTCLLDPIINNVSKKGSQSMPAIPDMIWWSETVREKQSNKKLGPLTYRASKVTANTLNWTQSLRSSAAGILSTLKIACTTIFLIGWSL